MNAKTKQNALRQSKEEILEYLRSKKTAVTKSNIRCHFILMRFFEDALYELLWDKKITQTKTGRYKTV